MYTSKDVGKFKVDIFKRRIKLINRDVKVKILKEKASEKNLNKIVKDFDIIVDGTDNFKTKFLILIEFEFLSNAIKGFIIFGALGQTRTGTPKRARILSPLCLPISPRGH